MNRDTKRLFAAVAALALAAAPAATLHAAPEAADTATADRGMLHAQVPMHEGEMPMHGGGRATVEGTLQAVDREAGLVTVVHGPVPEFDWPAMTMDFPVADMAVFEELDEGQAVRMEVLMQPDGSFNVTDAEPVD
ncbi:copper-binding protein [Ectothiorhodospiraceae bacterium 2226]|nr:copper-binding protein [Ectothiorhodospiraceae bacterium 2226]